MILPSLKFDDRGLIAAIVQEADTLEVLQFAWMNADALRATFEKGYVTFWSRSRRELWTKGETSGNRLRLVEVLYDCDRDCLLVKAQLEGTAVCHTGSRTDWYRRIEPRTVDVVDDYHGVKVADPYRWLEDLDSSETAGFVAAQNRLTEGFLSGLPNRDPIRERLTELWDYEKFGVPFRAGERLLYTRNDGLQNQSVLYEHPDRVLLDPNTWSDDGTVALTGLAASDDGRLLAYGVSSAGSDWQEWRVLDLSSGKPLDDTLQWVKFSGASWLPDGSAFYYSRYDEPSGGLETVNRFQKLYLHRVGTPQSEDALVYERPDQPDWGFGADVTEDGAWLVITVWLGTDPKTCIFVQSLPDGEIVELLPGFEAEYTFLGNDGAVLYLKTDRDAPRGSVIALDARTRERRVLVPEGEDAIDAATIVGDRLFVHTLHDASNRILVHHLDGRPESEVELRGLGSATGFGGRRRDTETFYSFQSFTRALAVYRYDLASGRSSLFRAPELAFDPDAYETQRVFYESRDGTRVPMFLTYRRDLHGPAPAYLRGYGGFAIASTPAFSVRAVSWLERGGIFASACIRGGGEYGEEWHQAGTKERKQNVFDDFCAAAEWLVANGWTTREQLAIGGGSNGGLLVGACITQRPELFGAAEIAVGVLDMLRFDKFTIGWAWRSDYGSTSEPEEFRALYAYSPLHNLKPGTVYPPTIITTADHDDRVWPGHSFKFAAAMQAVADGDAPVLLRVETRAGHGAGKPTVKQIEEAADVLAFLDSQLSR